MRIGLFPFIGMLWLIVSSALATVPTTPIAVEISGSGDSLQYTVDKKQMEFGQILPYLKTVRANFGRFMPCDIWITDLVPMSSVVRMNGIIKESGLESEIGVYLISPRVEGRSEHGDVIINNRALHKITISPFPVYPDATFPKIVPPVLSIQNK